jgi:hypothetical protein
MKLLRLLLETLGGRFDCRTDCHSLFPGGTMAHLLRYFPLDFQAPHAVWTLMQREPLVRLGLRALSLDPLDAAGNRWTLMRSSLRPIASELRI